MNDSNLFGGHEVTAVEAIRYILNFKPDIQISFIYWKHNKRLEERLNNIKNSKLKMYPIDYEWEKIKNLINLLLLLFSLPLPSEIKKIKHLIQKTEPDLVIVVQGSVHISSLGLLLSKKCGYKTISFIPLTHHFQVKGFYSALHYIICQFIYKLPSHFITISENAKQQLIKWNVDSPISVVFYGLDINQYKIKNKMISREKLGLSNSKYIIALIGRIQFSHKAQDFLVKTIYLYKDVVKDIQWLIVGDGPDSNKLKSMILERELLNYIKFLPWTSDLSDIYSAIDMLVIPSRIEGIPIVMLEAMYYELPIIASNIDGMAERLPKKWLFTVNNSHSMIETLLLEKNCPSKSLILENKNKILQQYTWEKYGENFYKVISNYLN